MIRDKKTSNDSVIFDLDGTLWDATPATVKGWNEALVSLGISQQVTPKDIHRVTGYPQKKCIDILLPGMSRKFRKFYELLSSYEAMTMRKEGGELYEGVLEVVPSLASKYRLFIVSNCEDWYLELFFKKYPLRKFFQDLDCFGTSNHPKNIMIKRLQNKHGLQSPVYVGDTAFDQHAARQAGIDFIFAGYGFGEAEKPAVSVNSFRDLAKIL
jgi:phosphoglycolate phosphatase